ncbi:alpha/beta fold hydrolase [Streptomyces tricolor]|nr:alpha/beta fold hydrolase [Streptomyces tricolor]
MIAHGFTGDVDRPHLRRVADVLRGYGAVVTFSFRGHGRSGGRSTVGDKEVLDLAAAVEWARGLGHPRVATVGFSMGGSVVLRHAALYGGTDAVVSVSAPGPLVLPGHRPDAPPALAGHPPRGPPGRPLRPAHPHPPPGLGPRPALPGAVRAADRPDAAADRARRPRRLLPARPPPDARRGGR